jgi:hypothetical protein
LEHKYTKLQSFNYQKLLTYPDGPFKSDEVSFKSIVTNLSTVYINGEGNFFDFELPSNNGGSTIKDIKIVRNDTNGDAYISDLLPGTEIKIRFTYETGFASGRECIIKLFQGTAAHTNEGRKIISHFADENGGENLTIFHNPGTVPNSERNQKQSGDIITFVRGDGFWYVTNINREKFILDQLSTSSADLDWIGLDGENNLILDTADRDSNADVAYIDSLIYLAPFFNQENGALIGYRWEVFSGALNFNPSTSLTSLDHPFKYILPGNSAPFFLSYSTLLNSQSSSFFSPPFFRITKDNLGYVRIKGSFRLDDIPNSQLRKTYSNGLGNQIYFARVTNAQYRPTSNTSSENYLTAWGFCEVILSSNNTSGMPNGQPQTYMGKIRVYPSGRIVLSFQMTNFSTTQAIIGTYRIDVNVPEFSYPTN